MAQVEPLYTGQSVSQSNVMPPIDEYVCRIRMRFTIRERFQKYYHRNHCSKSVSRSGPNSPITGQYWSVYPCPVNTQNFPKKTYFTVTIFTQKFIKGFTLTVLTVAKF